MSGLALRIALAAVALGALVAGALIVVNGLRQEPAEPISVERPAPGETRADYLPDGTPVWVIGHEDGTVTVLEAFDTHTPANLGKLTWWCEASRTIENPHHGSRWDERGVKLGGPAPAGLASWDVSTVGGRIVLGNLRGAPPLDAPIIGPPDAERPSCLGPENPGLTHTFDDWRAWDSPADAVASGADGWMLLRGELGVVDGRAVLCGTNTCQDVAIATHIEVPPPGTDPQFTPFGRPSEFIARVRDGALIELTVTANPAEHAPP